MNISKMSTPRLRAYRLELSNVTYAETDEQTDARWTLIEEIDDELAEREHDLQDASSGLGNQTA
jgi:hypothetical protein